jgi:hypothetical protein
MPEYSISQLENFETCPCKDKFVYVDKIKQYEESIEAFVGLRISGAQYSFPNFVGGTGTGSFQGRPTLDRGMGLCPRGGSAS